MVTVNADYVILSTEQSCPIGDSMDFKGMLVNSSNGTGIPSKTVNISFKFLNGTIQRTDSLTTNANGKFNNSFSCGNDENQAGTHEWNLTAFVTANNTVTHSGFFDVTTTGIINSTQINGSGIFSPGETILVTGKSFYANGTAFSGSINYALFKGNGMQILSGNATASNGNFSITLGPIPSDADGGIYFLNIENQTKNEVSFIIKPMNVHVELKNSRNMKTDTFKSNSNMTVEVSATYSSGSPVNGTAKLEFFWTNGTVYPGGSVSKSINGYAKFENQWLFGIPAGEYRLRVTVTSDSGVKSINEIPMFIGDYDLQVRPYSDANDFFKWGKYKGFGRRRTAVMLVALFDMQNSTSLNSTYFYCNSTHIPSVEVQSMTGKVILNNSMVNRHLVTDNFGKQHCTINFTTNFAPGKYKVIVQENMTGQALTSNGKISVFEVLLTGGSLGDDFKAKALFTPNQQFPLKLNAYNASSGNDITNSILTASITKMFDDQGNELNASNYIVSPFSSGKITMQAPSGVGVYSLKLQANVSGKQVDGDAMFLVKNFMLFGGAPPINSDAESFTIYGEAYDMDFNSLSDVVVGVQSIINEKDGKNWTNCINTSLSGRTSSNGPAEVPIVKTCSEDWDEGFYEVTFWAKRSVTVGNATTTINETGFGGFPVMDYWVNVQPTKEMVKPDGNLTVNISVVQINSSSQMFDPMMGEGLSGRTLPGFIAIPRAVSASMPGMEGDRDVIELINPPNCTTVQTGNSSMCQVTINGSHFPEGQIPTGFLDLEVEAFNASNPSTHAFGFAFFESTPFKVKISGMLWQGQPLFDPMGNPLIEGGNVSIRLNAFEELYSGGNLSKGFMGQPYSTRLVNVSFKSIRDAWTWQETGIVPTNYSFSTISIVNGTYWLNLTLPYGLPGKGEYIIEMEVEDINGRKSPFDVFTVITPFGYNIAPARVVWADEVEYQANGTEEWHGQGGERTKINATTLQRIYAAGVNSSSGKYKGTQVNQSGVLIDFVLVDNNTNAPGKYRTVLARDHNQSANFTVVSTGDRVSSNAFVYFWEMKEKSESEFWIVSNQTTSSHGDCWNNWCLPWFGIHPVNTNFTLPLKISGLNNQPLQANVSIYKVLSGWTWPPVDKTSAITSPAKEPNKATTNQAGIVFLTVNANDTGHYIPLFNISVPGKDPETADMETSWRFDFEIKHFVGWMDRFKNPRTTLLYNNNTEFDNTTDVNMFFWGRSPNSTWGPNGTQVKGFPMWYSNQSLDWDWSGNGEDKMSIAYFYDQDPYTPQDKWEWLFVFDNDNNMNETNDTDGFNVQVLSLAWDNRLHPQNSEKELLIAYTENNSNVIELGVGNVGHDEEFWQWNNSNETISGSVQVSKFDGEPLNGSNVSIQVNVDCFGPSKSGGACGGDLTQNVSIITNSFDSNDATNTTYANTPGNWQITDGSTFFTILPPQSGWPEGVGGGEIRIKLTVTDNTLGKTDTFNMNIHKEGEMQGPPGGPK